MGKVASSLGSQYIYQVQGLLCSFWVSRCVRLRYSAFQFPSEPSPRLLRIWVWVPCHQPSCSVLTLQSHRILAASALYNYFVTWLVTASEPREQDMYTFSFSFIALFFKFFFNVHSVPGLGGHAVGACHKAMLLPVHWPKCWAHEPGVLSLPKPASETLIWLHTQAWGFRCCRRQCYHSALQTVHAAGSEAFSPPCQPVAQNCPSHPQRGIEPPDAGWHHMCESEMEWPPGDARGPCTLSFWFISSLSGLLDFLSGWFLWLVPNINNFPCCGPRFFLTPVTVGNSFLFPFSLCLLFSRL